VSRYNSLFEINSDLKLLRNTAFLELENCDLRFLIKIRKNAEASKTFTLSKILNPYGVTDTYPKAYRFARDISPFAPLPKLSQTIRIAIHVRRGDILCNEAWRSRMLPNSCYMAVARRVEAILDEVNVSYVFELHTEMTSKAVPLSPNHHGILNQPSDSKTTKYSSNWLDDYDSIPSLNKFINLDPVDTLRKIATAHV
jgi:hypothetical protein